MNPYYDEDGITIYHGRCEEVLPQIAGGFDMVFTSPPYNLGNTSGGGFGHYAADARLGKRGGGGKWNGGSLSEGYDEHEDNMPHEVYCEWQKDVLYKCWTKLSDTGAIFYNHKPRVLAGKLVTPFDYIPKVPVRQNVIWARAGGINFSPTFFCPTHEWILILAKEGWRLKSKAASGIGDVWYVPQESGSPHQAPFPMGLPAKAIEGCAPKSVLDPFCGSGTTLRAAKDANVRAVGIESSERWCEYAAQRCGQLSLFGQAA